MRGWLASALILTGLVACGGDDDAPCAIGDTRECTGPGRCEGAQACLADESGFGDCDCGAAQGGVEAGAPIREMDAAADRDASPRDASDADGPAKDSGRDATSSDPDPDPDPDP